MNDQGSEPEDLVRTQTLDADGPLELDVDISAGRVDITLGEGDPSVEVRHDPDRAASPPWANGPAAYVMDWVSEFLGQQPGSASPASTVQQTRLEQTGNRVVVHAPKSMPPRTVPLAVTVHAPEGSHVRVRTHAASVTVTGETGRADVATHSGDVTLGRIGGAATVRTQSGAVRLGHAPEGLHLRASSGNVEVTSLSGSATLATSSGLVWLGETAGEVKVRTSSGNLTVADAVEGTVEAITGSGEIRVGVRAGTTAELELSSGGGRVSSELDVADAPPEGPVALQVRGGSGAGDVVVTRATPVAAA